jgi:protein tyrosine phosphatase
MKDFNGERRYIAAQGPIDESITDFLRMIWEYQITSVICTANEIEAGRVKTFLTNFFILKANPFQFKFRRYWPDDEKSVQFGSYRVSKVPI